MCGVADVADVAVVAESCELQFIPCVTHDHTWWDYFISQTPHLCVHIVDDRLDVMRQERRKAFPPFSHFCIRSLVLYNNNKNLNFHQTFLEVNDV